MLVEKHISDKTAFVAVKGRIDTTTVGILREELKTIDYDSVDRLEMDFSDVLYISSAGLRELLSLKKRLDGKAYHIGGVNREVEEIFQITGFSSFLEYSVTDSEKDYRHLSFKEFLALKVQHEPEKIVLEAGDEKYTWQDIDRCAQIIAGDLSKLGVKKGSHVAICGMNSANWIMTFYAVQKLGAIALLVNFNLMAPEIVDLSHRGDMTHFCFGEMPQVRDEQAFLAGITGEGSMIQTVYDIRSSIRFMDRIGEYEGLVGRFEAKVEADDACVMIFTSGSTGSPKGVLLSAYNILNAACSNAASLYLTEKDRACLILPLFHIFGLVAGLFANAVADAEMIIPSSLKTDELIRVVAEKRCTVFHAVPTMFLAIVNNRSFDPAKFSSLRSTILSGASASEAQMRMLQEMFPNNHFAASYGLSEMAPVTITDYDDTLEHVTQTIGKPIPGIEIRIWDEEKKRACEPGKPGEIQIQGYNLMTCYYKTELIKQAIDEDGWLHTGDLGVFDRDGYIRFVGRTKELIIRGGENIVPNEIASAISELGDVADVKVVGVPDDFYGEIVAAALLMKEGVTFDEAATRVKLADKLAKYKIPAHFLVYDRFPMLPNGKVDMVNLKKDVVATVKGKQK